MPQDHASIQRFLQKSGRLDFQGLDSFAREHDEQEFVRLLRVPVLMGNEVLEGSLAERIGDATVFHPSQPDCSKRPVLLRPPLMHWLFPFFKQGMVDQEVFFSLGRSENNDFVIPDYTVAKTQAGIRRTAAHRYLLRSASATNPTLLNGKRCDGSEVFLHDEDRLTTGRYEWLFLSPSALYARLKGMALTVRIQQLLDSLGKADYVALKQYAIRHGQEMFVQLISNPSLVGSGLFRGYAVERSDEDTDITLAFLPDLTFGAEPKHLKVLERAIYPLVPPDVPGDGDLVIRLGRAEGNDIIMPEGSISNFHATINPLGPGQYWLTDSGSTNGTFLNDKPVPSRGNELLDRDRVKLGRFEFTFLFPGTLYSYITPENIRRP
ncbi:MAG: FHA domain-containing protein [Magnetococcales bacterium]|nr:FHA domain-containing protein [Magnetococcales bacterium]